MRYFFNGFTISALVMVLTWSPVGVADSKVRHYSDRWIVELIEAPTLEFTGTDLALQRSGQRFPVPMMEATAPSATGGARFDAGAPHVQAYVDFLQQRQNDVLADASRELRRELTPEGSFHHVANGMVLSVSAEEAARLRELPGVARVYREPLYRLELSSGPSLIGARALNEGGFELPGVKGEGVVVGIIDSGINWNHRAFSDNPADTGGYVFANPKGAQLGLCARASVPCNDKLIGVYDFTNNSTEGLDTDGHGTHVAAIAVANEWRSGQAGVAPRANLVSYRVCVDQDPDDPDSGTCQGGAITQALDRAIVDRVDVVNFSIGGGPLDPWSSSTARQVLNLRDAGITFATSAGNSGPAAGTVGWPAEAPWLLAVGSTTTDSCAQSQLQVQGLGSRTILYGTGPNLSGPDLNNVLVRTGGSFGNNFLGCDAFPPGAFDNAVALLERGTCTFEIKVQNAHNAGARAVLVFNSEASGRICMAGLEGSAIPSAMLSRDHGLELNGLINSGSPQRVSFNRQSLADQVSSFSSRGPSENVPRLMKPNLMAPGSGIQAAYIPGPEDVGGLSGTSMASPHVAGAVALLRQLDPALTPAMISSMLETTAEAAPVTVAGNAATIFDRGAGRVRVDLAARAGLFLPVSRADFLAANPSTGGDPGALNLPGLVNENCGTSCTFTRTVSAIRGGSWTVSGEGEVGVSVSPNTFSLEPGQSRQLQITISPRAGSTALQHGSVVLSPANLSAPVPGIVPLTTQRLPIGVRSSNGEAALPPFVRLEAESASGRSQLGLGFVESLSDAQFRTSALMRPQVENFSLPQDPANGNPYDRSAGTRTFLIDVPEGALALWAETTASSAPDIDLFVGRDSNGDGIAQSGEERCRSVTPDELERCVIEVPQAGQWWVVVQNWQASGSGADSIELQLAVLTESQSTDLIAFGPGRHEAGPLSLDLYWNRPDLKTGERLLGVLGIASHRDRKADIGVVPLAVQRNTPLVPETTLIFKDETLAVAVPANGVHDRLVFDVPPTATAIRVQVQGDDDVSGTLLRVPFSAIRETAPSTPTPQSPSLVTGSNSKAGFTLAASGNVEPGRYFVELQNSAASDRVVDVSLEIEESAGVVPRFGLWSPVGSQSNPRDIAQGIEWQQAGDGFTLWYSYEPSGLPVFYLGTSPLKSNSSVWVSDVSRFTLGTAGQIPDLAGRVSITAISAEELVFSWRLAGGHGSDIKLNLESPTCPVVDGQPVSYTGTWFTPGEDQGGSSVVITDNAQGHIRYYYDDSGVGRWVLATDGGGEPLAEELPLLEFRGFCPNCAADEVDFEIVGSYFRSYDNADQGIETLEFTSRPPLSEDISIAVPIRKLSAPMPCP